MKKLSNKAITSISNKFRGENRRNNSKKSNLSPNWNQLKLDYIHSDHITVIGFLEEASIIQTGEKPNGTIARIVLGWKKVKLEYLEAKYLEEAEFRAQQSLLQSRYSYSNNAQKKIRILNELDKRICLASQRTESGQFLVSAKDLCLMLEKVKIELGESNSSPAPSAPRTDLNSLIQYINDSDQPFDRREYERKQVEERLADIPDIIIDGKVMSVRQN